MGNREPAFYNLGYGGYSRIISTAVFELDYQTEASFRKDKPSLSNRSREMALTSI